MNIKIILFLFFNHPLLSPTSFTLAIDTEPPYPLIFPFSELLGGQMYAIIESGGKQYRVEKGDVIDVELLEAEAGQKIAFKHVLFLNTENGAKIGAPHVPNVIVHGEFVEEVKGPKVIAFKYKRRKPVRRKVGHRQRYSRIKITEIG